MSQINKKILHIINSSVKKRKNPAAIINYNSKNFKI